MKLHLNCITLLGIVFGMVVSTYAQDPNCYRIYLSDKNNNPYSIDNPSAFLSQRAIDKRVRFNIPITEQDLPVNPQYKQQIQALNAQIQILAVSKWMNTISIYCTNNSIVQQISNLPFVDSVAAIGSTQLQDNPVASVPENPVNMMQNVPSSTKEDIDYGGGYTQIAMHNGHRLHAKGYKGEGMLIVVIDGGFKTLEDNSFYQKMVDQGRFVGKYSLRPNFVNETGSGHGMRVMSVMAADESGILVGTAPKASYAVIQSECPETEQPFEEDLLANAFEIADSLGADIINTSLGYTIFDEYPQGNHSYEELDGQTCFATRCANLLNEKGIVTCVSAGNNGNNDWYYISTPTDANNVLSVGGCNIDSVITDFSSHGPSYDGRVKPDVTSLGNWVRIYYFPGASLIDAGTSYSSPIIAGLSACLWQALPQFSASEIMQLIRESGHLYDNPSPEYGYGIPDFYRAYASIVGIDDYNPLQLSVYPNPVTDKLHLTNLDGDIQSISIFNAAGQLVLQQAVNGSALIEINVTSLTKGLYIGTATMKGNKTANFKFLK